ncbi:MAG TPA: hypothetical protein DDW49_10360 [Deltaproteobacteria bacterium]|nr:hypothetical protein [Deltaproteobacteria bacterium]
MSRRVAQDETRGLAPEFFISILLILGENIISDDRHYIWGNWLASFPPPHNSIRLKSYGLINFAAVSNATKPDAFAIYTGMLKSIRCAITCFIFFTRDKVSPIAIVLA